MQLSEIFENLINSPDLTLILDVPNLAVIEQIKQDLSNYKHRHKKEYESILGAFRLRYTIIKSNDLFKYKETLKLKIEIDAEDQTKFYEGVTIHGS